MSTNTPDTSAPKRYTVDDFADEVRTWSNRQLASRAGQEIHAAAVMAGFRCNDGKHDAMCDAIYRECARRGNTDLYQRGFNEVAREQGHSGMAQPISTPIEQGEELREASPSTATDTP